MPTLPDLFWLYIGIYITAVLGGLLLLIRLVEAGKFDDE